jgi:HEAT repeat protein
MMSDFELALRELCDESKAILPHRLAFLSCPSRQETEAFLAALGSMSLARKRQLLSSMVEAAEEHFELDFSALFWGCLDDQDEEVRRQAVEGLWEDEQPHLADRLLVLLAQDPSVGVRAAAAGALGRFVYLAECEELDARRAAKIRQALEKVIADPQEDLEVARRAVESIAFVNDDTVRGIIERAYRHPDPRMRESAVFAMGRNADAVWAEAVLTELYADSAAMRYEAARASGELQLREAVDRLIELAEGADRDVQSAAVWSLGQIGGKQAEAALRRWIRDDDETLSAAASEALDELEFVTRPLELFVHDLAEKEEQDEGWDAFGLLDEDEDLTEEDEDDWDEDDLELEDE